MVLNIPLYFEDYERVFNFSTAQARTTWKRHAAVLEKGLAVYQRRLESSPLNRSNELTLDGSPTGYDAKVGDHDMAIAAISKALDLHEAQALLLLKRWIRATGTHVYPGWAPSRAQLSSLQRSYDGQRWHHLLCMQAAVDACNALDGTASASVDTIGRPGVDLAMPVSPSKMISSVMDAVAHNMQSMTSNQLLGDGKSDHGARGALLLNSSKATSEGTAGQAACELCLMLQITLSLLSITTESIGSVLKVAKSISDAVAQSGGVIFHDHLSVQGLIPRYAVAILLQLMRCRETLEALESGSVPAVSNSSDGDALVALSAHFLQRPLSESSALAPCILTCAAQLHIHGNSSDTKKTCQNLVLAAEACSPIATLKAMLNHDSLSIERLGLFSEGIFFAVGTWCQVFALRPTTMPRNTAYQFLAIMGDLLGNGDNGLAMRAWSGRPGSMFVRELIEDCCSIFPVFPIPFATFLASLCTDRDSRECAWRALQDLGSFTAYLDEKTQGALKISRSTVTIRDHACHAIQQVVSQIAPIREPGRLVPMPQLAEQLNVGNGCLVRWSLQTSVRSGLGFVLMIEEIMDQSQKMHQVLSRHGDHLVLEHIVHTLAACTGLLARLLHHDPWRVLDLLHRSVAGAQVAGYALCSAAHNTLSVIGFNSKTLSARAQGHSELFAMAAGTAGSCLDILSSVALMLPSAVLQMLTSDLSRHIGAAGTLSGQGPMWLVSMLEGVHELESGFGKYPAAVASIKLVRTLLMCMGLTDDLSTIAVQVMSGMGCYHSQWHLSHGSDNGEMTLAILSMLHSALCRSGLQVWDKVEERRKSGLLQFLLADGLLPRLFWANLPEPYQPCQASELFSNLPGKQMDAAGECMKCVAGMVDMALATPEVIVPALFRFLFTEQGGGWSVVATLNSYASELYHRGGAMHDVPLRYISSLMLLVSSAKDVDTDLVPAPSFTSLMCLPGEGVAPAVEPTEMLRHLVAEPLKLERSLEHPEEALMAVMTVESCLTDHPTCSKSLLESNELKTESVEKINDSAQETVNKAHPDKTIPPSLVDVVWTSLQDMAKPDFNAGDPNQMTGALPILQMIHMVIGSGHSAGAVLMSQKTFWEDLQAVWSAVSAELGGSNPDACLRAAAHILDVVSSVLHRKWHQQSQSLSAAGELLSLGIEPEMVFASPDAGSGEHSGVMPSEEMPPALFALFQDICSVMPAADHGLYACLERWQPRSAQTSKTEGEQSLIDAAQAAALLVSTFLDASIPAELSPHAMGLWKELNSCFADVHSVTNGMAAEDINSMKLSLLESLLGIHAGAADIGDHIHEMREFKARIDRSRCHVPILARLYNPSLLRHEDSCCVDPQRWLLLANGLHMLEASSEPFHLSACQCTFNLLRRAISAVHTLEAINGLLSSYSRLLTVAVSRDEGVQTAKAFLGSSAQITLIQHASEAWNACVECSISESPARTQWHGHRHGSALEAAPREEGNINEGDWLPSALTHWGKAKIHLEIAQNLLCIANLAATTERTCGAGAAGTARMRREPSFAQLAGACTTAKEPQSSADEPLCAVLEACKDVLPHIAAMRTRMSSSPHAPGKPPDDGMQKSLSTFLELVLEAIVVRKEAVAAALSSSQKSVGGPTQRGVAPHVLDATRALCEFALQNSSDDSAMAMSVLLGLVSTMGHAEHEGPHASAAEIFAAVPLHQVLAAAARSIPTAPGAEALHADLAKSRYQGVALMLIQQLGIFASLKGTPPSDDTFSQLLRLLAALTPAEHSMAELDPALPWGMDAGGAGSVRSLSGFETGESENSQSNNRKLIFPGVKTVAIGPRGTVVTAHQVSTKGLTIRLGGQAIAQRERRTAFQQVVTAGYTSSGQRLVCAVMHAQVMRVLALLLTIPKTPEPILVTVLTTQQVQLHMRASSFCGLLYAQPTGEPFILTRALIEDLLACLDLWYVLVAHKGLLLLSAPTAVKKIQQALCHVLNTIAHLPMEQAAIARLSTAPVDATEARLAEEPTTKASEALLGLHHFWFWVCSVCKSGACSVEAVNMPTWARKSSSKTPRPGSKHPTSSPEYFHSTGASRSYSPNRMQRDSRSPRPLSPPAGCQSSRSPSASPVTSLVPHTSFVSGSIPAFVDDVESTRHSEQLAIGVYQIAGSAVRVLSILEPQREAGEIETGCSDSWLGMSTALNLQRHCFDLSRHLDRNQGDRSVDDVARRKIQDGLVCSLVDILDYTSQVAQERSHARSDGSAKSLPASHWRQVNTSRAILRRLVDS